MKIVLVHNYYGTSSPSGENIVYEAERSLLQAHGHEILEFTRHSDELRNSGLFGLVKGALTTPWNPLAAIALRKMVASFQPDVVHVHNTFPLISPAIFSSIGGLAPKVLTLHNYRLFCPAAIPLRNGQVCTACIETRSTLPALKFGCYRNSHLATLPLALNSSLHRLLGTWDKDVDAFITLSKFQQKLMIEAGLDHNNVFVKPNFFPGKPQVLPWIQRSCYALYVGRLSHEKGVADLIQAWRYWGQSAPELRIIGDGNLRQDLERLASGLRVRFLGQLSSADAQQHISGSRLLVLPSVCYEGFPMVIREAFAFGTPVAVSNLGPLPSIVQHDKSGLVFESGNPNSLLKIVRDSWENPCKLQDLGENARYEFEMKYTEDANISLLMNIYNAAINNFKNSQHLKQ